MHKIFKNIFLFFVLTLTTRAGLAAEIKVNETCAFEDAITAANNDAEENGCTAGSGDDVIILPSKKIITLTAPVSIDTNIKIQTKDLAVINANDLSVFTITAAVDFSLTNIKIIHAKSTTPGSVIYSDKLNHKVNLVNVWIDSNTDTPIDLTNGELKIIDATFSNNSDGDISGGAILGLKEHIIITNSTFYSNQNTNTKGGAINTGFSTLEIYNSTFSKNTTGSSGGALWTNNNVLKILNSLFIANTAVILGDDLANSESDYIKIFRNNLFSESSKDDLSAICTDCLFDSEIVVGNYNKKFGFIPLTQESSAIDAGKDCINPTGDLLKYDQRGVGFDRVVGTSCDVGAIEFQDHTPLPESVCGDGNIDTDQGEECDGGDTCNADCTLKSVSPTKEEPICGNGVKEGDEECDDGNTVDTDDCSNKCKDVTIKKEINNDPTSDSNGCSAGGILGFLPLLFGAGALKTLPFFRML